MRTPRPFRRLPKTLALLALVLGVSGLAGCRAFTFDRDWKRGATSSAVAPSAAAPAPDPAGRWQGSWHSEGTGHSGKLRAIVGRAPTRFAPGRSAYEVRFDAVWGGVFRFGETVTLRVAPVPATATQPAGFTFDDIHDAGWLGGGVYEFKGAVTDDTFTCRYQGKHDHGTFEMKRVWGKADR
jgi:hypothetical protein